MNGLLKRLFTGLLLLCFIQLVAQPTFSITPANNLIDQGNSFTVDIRVSNFTNVASIQFPITWDDAIISYQSISNINSTALPGLSSASFGVPGSGNSPDDQVVLSWNHPNFTGVNLADQTVLFSLTFQGELGGTTSLEFNENLPQSIEILDPQGNDLGFVGNDAMVTVNGSGGGPAGFTLSLADVNANTGDNVCLPMTVNDFNNILGMQFSVNYDAGALAFTGSQNFNAALVGFTSASIGNPTPGNLTFTWNDPFAAGVTLPNGATLVELCFDVTGSSTSTVSFSGNPTPIEIIDGNEMTVPFSSESGTITVGGGGGPSGFTLSLADVNANTGDNVCLPMTVNDFNNILGMQFSVNYDAGALAFTGSQNFNAALVGFTSASIGNPTPGNLTFTWNDPFAAGVTLPNGATLVELCFDVTGSSTSTVSFSGNPTPIEIIDGNEMTVPFSSESGTITVGGGGGPSGFTLSLADVNANTGDNVCLPMTVNDFNNILGMQFSVNYDAGALAFTGSQNFNAALVGFTSASIGNPTPGNLTFTWNDPFAAGVTLPNGATLVELCFDVTGSSTSTVSFSGNPTPIEIIDGNEMTVPFSSESGTITVGGGGGPSGFTLSLADVNANTGDNVCLPMTVNDFNNILGMQFSVNYDASALTFTGSQNFNAALVGFTSASIGNPTPGNLTFTWNDPFAAGVTLPNGATLVELCFDVTGSSTTTVSFSGNPTPIEIIDSNEMEVPFSSESGTITIGGTGGPSPITLTLADLTANMGDNVCLPMTVTNFTDIVSMQYNINYDASILSFTGAQNFNASLPGWGAASITNPSAGVLTVSWSTGTGVTLADGSSLVNLCFDVVGNTTSNVTIPAPITIMNGDGDAVTTNTNSGTVTINPPIEGFTLILADATANNGDNVCLPITVNDFDNILGMQFSLNYDATALTFTGSQNFNAALVGLTSASIGNPTPGNLTFTWNDPFAAGVSLPDGATLFELCFDVTTDMSTTVVFSGMPTPIEIIDGDEMEVDFNSIPGTISPPTSGPLPITLTLADLTANMGDNVCLPMTVTNFTDIVSMQYNINYDASILSFTGAQNFNASLPGWGAASITNPSAGVLTVSWSTGTGVTLPNGSSLVNLCFDVVGNTTSNVTIPAPITIMNGDGDAVTTNTNSGTVTINPPIEGFTLILADATANNGDNVCLPITVNDFDNILGMQFSLNYDATALTFTGSQNFNAALVGLTSASIGNPTPGNLTFTWNDPFAAGVSLPDGATLFELCFDVTTDMSTTVVFSGMPTPIEIIDGDEMEVDFNSIPGTISPPTSGPLPITLTLADLTANMGDNVCLPMTVTNFTDIVSMQYNINYDASILSFTGAQNFNASLPGWGAASITNPSAGVLTVSWSTGTGVTLPNGSSLVNLCFDVVGNTTSNVTIPAPITIMNGDGDAVTTNTNSGTVTINPPIEGFTLILADATANNGDNVCLPITVNDFDNILGMQFSLNYDATALTFTGSQNFNAALVGLTSASIGNPTPGNLTFTWNDPFAAGVSLPDGATLFELCFDVTTDMSTTVVFSGMPTPIEIIDGDEMEVDFNSIPGTISPPATGPLPITLTLADVTADMGDNVCLPMTVTNFTDIVSMQYNINYDASILSFTGAQNFNASLPGWGAASITNPSAGVLTVSWSTGTGVTLADGSSLVNLCFDVVGNTTSNVTIPAPITIMNGDGDAVTTNTNSGTVSITPPVDGFALILADATANNGDNVCLPITVNDFVNILGMQFSLNYDATALTFTGSQNFNAALVGLTSASIGNPPPPGNLTFTWNDPFAEGVTLPDGATLFELCFDVTTDMSTTVVFSGTPTPIEIIDGDEMEVDFTGIDGTITIGQDEPGTFAVSLTTEEACTGDDFCMDFTASTFTNIQGMQFSITYNSSDLSFSQVSDINPGLPGLTTASFNPGTGVITFQWESSTADGVSLNPNSVLFSLCFNKLSDNNTTVTIGGSPTPIEIVDSNEDLVTFNGTTGEVTCDPVLPLEFGQVDVVDLTCADEPTGSITIVSMVNGSGNYTYQWSVPGETGPSISNRPASTVNVTVTDNETGMMVSGTYNIISPPAITANVEDITNILCAGESTGSITISASGGVEPLSFDWSGSLPDNVMMQSNLPAGSYSVTIIDDNGCDQVLGNIQVNELAQPIVLSGTVTPVPGDGNPGGIDLTVAGGSPGYMYSWTGPDGYTFMGEDPNNITVAGEYCVTVTDSFGCMASTCFDVCEVLRLTFFNIMDACPGGTGSIDITIAGGCCPDMNSYRWIDLADNSDVALTQDLMDQPAGTYRVMITDCTGTSISADFTIDENDPIVLEASVTDVMSLNDGAVTLTTVSGGSGSGYTYSWTGPDTYVSMMRDITNLVAGAYCVTVTDGAGCTQSACYTVNPAQVSVIQQVPSPVSCPGDTDGCIFLAISGGQQPMNVTLNDGENNIGPFPVPPSGQVEICNLAAGDYDFDIIDSGVGNFSGSFNIGEPMPLANTATVVNDTEDAGGSGSVTILVNGGTGTPQITWNGYPAGPAVIGITGPTTVTGIIEDDNGCTLPISYEVLQMTETAVITDAGCTDSTDGAITVTAAGGTEPYTYEWTAEGSTVIISTDPTIENLAPNTYTVIITDGTGATLIRTYDINTQSDFTASAAIITDLDCFDSVDGEIQAMVENNGASSSFDYEFELDGAMVGANGTGFLGNAAPGVYTITVIDNFMCEQQTTVELEAPEPITVSESIKTISCDDREDGEIFVDAMGGTPPYTYAWSTGQFTQQLTSLAPGTYTLTVTDARDCQVIESYDIDESSPIIVTIETTPHTDADNCDGSVMAIVLGGNPPYEYDWLNIPGNPDTGTVLDLCAGTYMLQVTDANGCSSEVVSGTVADERFECFEDRVVITPDGNGSNDEFIIFCADALTDNHLEIYNRWGQLVFETDNYSNDWEGTSLNGDELPAGPYYWVLDYSSPGSGEPLQKRGSLTIVRDN